MTGSAEASWPGDAAARRESGPPGETEQRLLVELGWLCGLPIAVTVVFAIAVRIDRLSALADFLAGCAVAAVAVGGAVRNAGLVRSALKWPTLSDLVATALVGVVGAPVLIAAFWGLEGLGFQLYTGYLTPYAQDGWPAWVGFASVALIAPVGEELLFRGLVQPKLGQLVNPTEAVVVQAAVFAALHLSVVILITHFAIGLAFGWLRRRSGSLLPGMLLHGAWNSWVVWSTAGGHR